MNSIVNWKQYQQIRRYLDKLNLDDEVIHSVALRAASLGLKRVKLSVCRFNAERKTWRKRKRELTLSDMQASTTRSFQQACGLKTPSASTGESIYTTQALDRHERWADMAAVHKLLQKAIEDWGDYPVSLEKAVEMAYPGKKASPEKKRKEERVRKRLSRFRKRWKEKNGTISTPE